jgi:hypothetical protein
LAPGECGGPAILAGRRFWRAGDVKTEGRLHRYRRILGPDPGIILPGSWHYPAGQLVF